LEGNICCHFFVYIVDSCTYLSLSYCIVFFIACIPSVRDVGTIAIVRLERVTLRTLVDSLGLGPDLFLPMPQPDPALSFIGGSGGSGSSGSSSAPLSSSSSSSAKEFTVGLEDADGTSSSTNSSWRLYGLNVLANAAGLNRHGTVSTMVPMSSDRNGNEREKAGAEGAAATSAAWLFFKAQSWRDVPLVHLKPGETLDTAAYLYMVVDGIVESFFARPTTASTSAATSKPSPTAARTPHSRERDSAPYRGTGASRVCSMSTGPGEVEILHN